MVITDGPDTNSEKSESEMMDVCIPRDSWPEEIKLHTVGIGGDVDEILLTRIVNRANGRFIRAASSDIQAALDLIAQE